MPGINELFGQAANALGGAQEVLGGVPFMRKIDETRLFYEMETKGSLRDLAEQIVEAQTNRALENLRIQVQGGFVTDVFQSVKDGNIEDAERRVREEMEKDPERTQEIIAQYHKDPQQILRSLENGELTEPEAQDLAQEILKDQPIVQQVVDKTGFELDAVSAATAGIFVQTKKIPTNTWDIIKSLMSGMEGLMHFRVTGRAAEKIGVEKSSIRAVYNIGVFEFSDIIKTLRDEMGAGLLSGPVSEENVNKLKERHANQSIKSDERRIINFLLKNPKNPQELNKLFSYVTNKENVEFSLSELDKTFMKDAQQNGETLSGAEMRKRSDEFFRNEVSIGTMLEYKFSLKEDRETLVSYTMASLLRTAPRVLQGQFRLRTMTSMFQELSENPKAFKAFNRSMGKSWNIVGRYRKLGKLVDIETSLRKGTAITRGGAEVAGDLGAIKKTARGLGGFGRVLRYARPGLLAASEVYNVSTGRSNVSESIGRFAGGMLRVVPFIGTGLDFTEAITGKDQLNGQVLTGTERLARAGWGVLGAMSDLALLIPGAGVLIKGGVIAARTARVAKVARATRIGAMGVGLGAGIVAPLLTSSEMREAAGATAKVGVMGVKGMGAAFSLLAGPSGGAADRSVAMARLKSATGDVARSTVEETKNIGGDLVERSGELLESVAEKRRALLDNLENKIGGWDPDARTQFEEYIENSENASRLGDVQGLMDEKSDRIERIFSDPTLSTRQRHESMTEFIETNRSGREA